MSNQKTGTMIESQSDRIFDHLRAINQMGDDLQELVIAFNIIGNKVLSDKLARIVHSIDTDTEGVAEIIENVMEMEN